MFKMLTAITGLQAKKLCLVIIACFFLINTTWVKLDQRVPIIGDDPRWLQGTYELTEPLKKGDLSGFYQTWQNLYVKNTNSLPRTPLFALLSVPTFLLFGANEDNAIITNLLVQALNAYLIMLLLKQFFPENPGSVKVNLKKSRDSKKSDKSGSWLLPLGVLLFSLAQGTVGFGRLYMSETLQTFFVLLITYLMVRYRKQVSLKNYAVLGILCSLAMLLRFIMPVYLAIPGLVFIYEQIKQKRRWTYYVKAILVFLLCFLPLTLTWYDQNFNTYMQFANYTTSGELAKYTSLGPVWHPLTIARFWYVITIWIFGWPMAVLAVTAIILRVTQNKAAYFRKFSKKQWLLLIIPTPALLAATISDNKTARYFLPVIGFWIVFIAYEVNFLLQHNGKAVKYLLVFLIILTAYPFKQSLLIFLPQIPKTGLNYAAGPFDSSLQTQSRYSFFYTVYSRIVKIKGEDAKIYTVPEQTRFNEAELVWFGTQKGIKINSLGEFTRYLELSEGKQKIAEADILLVETNPETGSLYRDKYLEMVDFARSQPDFVKIDSLDLPDDKSSLEIYVRI